MNEEAKAWIELGRAAADVKNTESKSHLDKAWDHYADSAYTMGSRVIDTLALSSAAFGVLARAVAAGAPARLGAGGILAEAARAGARAQILAAALGVVSAASSTYAYLSDGEGTRRLGYGILRVFGAKKPEPTPSMARGPEATPTVTAARELAAPDRLSFSDLGTQTVAV